MPRLDGKIYDAGGELIPVGKELVFGVTRYRIGSNKYVQIDFDGVAARVKELIGNRPSRRKPVTLFRGQSATFTEGAFAGKILRGGRLHITTEVVTNFFIH